MRFSEYIQIYLKQFLELYSKYQIQCFGLTAHLGFVVPI